MTIDIDAVRNRAYHAANYRHRWASEVGVTDVDVLDGLRRAKQLAVDDVPALLAKVAELTAELAEKDAVVDAAKAWRRAVAETGDYEISDSDVLIAAIDALPKGGVL